SGQIGDCLSAMGAVNAWGTSPGRLSGVGLGVVQPVATRANMLTDRPRKIAFIEHSSNKMKPDGPRLAPPHTRRMAIHANMARSALLTRVWTVKLCRGRNGGGDDFTTFRGGKRDTAWVPSP